MLDTPCTYTYNIYISTINLLAEQAENKIRDMSTATHPTLYILNAWRSPYICISISLLLVIGRKTKNNNTKMKLEWAINSNNSLFEIYIYYLFVTDGGYGNTNTKTFTTTHTRYIWPFISLLFVMDGKTKNNNTKINFIRFTYTTYSYLMENAKNINNERKTFTISHAPHLTFYI